MSSIGEWLPVLLFFACVLIALRITSVVAHKAKKKREDEEADRVANWNFVNGFFGLDRRRPSNERRTYDRIDRLLRKERGEAADILRRKVHEAKERGSLPPLLTADSRDFSLMQEVVTKAFHF